MNKISVAIATYNEEKNIARSLASVADWVNEIIIVDGSSQDKTAEVARKYRAKVIVVDNPPIFHINKQKAIDKCTSEWILQLDADEVVTLELRDDILAAVNKEQRTKNKEQINGYWIPRRNYFLGKFLEKGGQYPDYTMRLYRKGKGRLPCKSVHEQAEVEGNVSYLKSPLLHFPYTNFSEYLEHFNRYTSIFADELKEEDIRLGIISFISYIFIKPNYWFLMTYFRHRGFQDGFPGFVFSLFSALRFPVIYVKYWEEKKNERY